MLDLSRFTSAAQDLVMHSRGKPEGHHWQTSDGAPGTIDDISVFVIPLAAYKKEWEAWKLQNEKLRRGKTAEPSSGKPAQSAQSPTNRYPTSGHLSSSDGWFPNLDGRTETPHQNGGTPGNVPVEVGVPHSNASDLTLAEISLDAEEVVAPEDTPTSNSENVDLKEGSEATASSAVPENGDKDNTDPSSANYCER